MINRTSTCRCRGEPMRYYWMSHLLSGAVYRNLRQRGVTSEQVVLINGLAFGVAFVAFIVCEFSRSPRGIERFLHAKRPDSLPGEQESTQSACRVGF